jgi:peptide/nickel transport system ATP-binding protein/oligopeptide transport system ATP-binding protein
VSPPLLQVDGLVRHFAARRSAFGRAISTVKAVDGVNLAVQEGSTLALVGETGCGKSTVGRLILRLIEPTAGQISFQGRDILAFNERELRAFRRQAQIVFQDPYASLNPRMTVEQILTEPLALHEIVAAARRRDRVNELLSLVGLDARFSRRYPHEFSGGQRQRIAIARALAVEPNLLSDLQRRLALTYVFISHDLSVVKHIANRVAVMYLGRIVETAQADDLFANPRHPYTRALLAAIPLPRPRARRQRQLLVGDVPSPIFPPTGCHLHPRCAFAVERCRVERPPLIDDTGGHATACHRWREVPAGTAVVDDAGPSPRLERLMADFARKSGVRGSGTADIPLGEKSTGVPVTTDKTPM